MICFASVAHGDDGTGQGAQGHDAPDTIGKNDVGQSERQPEPRLPTPAGTLTGMVGRAELVQGGGHGITRRVVELADTWPSVPAIHR